MARFELARSKSNGLAIHRLNHSATLSYDCVFSECFSKHYEVLCNIRYNAHNLHFSESLWAHTITFQKNEPGCAHLHFSYVSILHHCYQCYNNNNDELLNTLLPN